MDNLTAFLLPLLLLSFWWLIGYSTLSLLHTQTNFIRNMLLAPSVGLAITTIAVFLPNWYGLPVQSYALVLLLGLFVCSVIVLVWRQPLIPWRKYWPFLLILLFALALTGWPLLHFGFNWLSYSNDDMANYCLTAQRLLSHGYMDIPDIKPMIAGKAYSLFYWQLHAFGARAGSDLLLAWLCSITQLAAPQLFMPLIVAFHLTLVSAAGALSYSMRRWRSAALTTCLLAACSPLLNLGVFYQLLAQTSGLSLFVLSTILVFKTNFPKKLTANVKHGILAAVAISTFLIVYEEIVAFFVVSYLIFFMTMLARKNRPNLKFYLLWLFIITLIFLILGKYLLNVIGYQFLIQQFSTILVKKQIGVFPYFLNWNGLALLWGFQGIANPSVFLWELTTILLGLLLLIWVVINIFRLSWHQFPAAVITLLMLIVGACLLYAADGFGLFKLAMYVQAFLLCVTAISLHHFFERRTAYLAALIIIMLQLPIQHYYSIRSLGSIGSFVELPNASKEKLLEEISKKIALIPQNSPIILTTTNIVEHKLTLYYTIGKQAFSLSRTCFFEFIYSTFHYLLDNPVTKLIYPEQYQLALKNQNKILNSYSWLHFNLLDPKKPNLSDLFVEKNIKLSPKDTFVFDTGNNSIFNRRYLYDQNGLALLSWKEAQNHLVFVHSRFGQNYYYGEAEFISLFPLQEDYFYPTQTGANVGRYLLFSIINPTGPIRAVIDMSTTINPAGYKKLPDMAIIDHARKPLSINGSGSARVISPIIAPVILNHIPHFMIDMDNTDSIHPPEGKYAWIRDISLITDAAYQQITPPSIISHFPKDLANPNLFYSGVYEDGWLPADSSFTLAKPQQRSVLIIKGLVTATQTANYSTVLSVTINDKRVLLQKLLPGPFTLRIPDNNKNLKSTIVLHFSNYFYLPHPDSRPVAAKLESIGYNHHDAG